MNQANPTTTADSGRTVEVGEGKNRAYLAVPRAGAGPALVLMRGDPALDAQIQAMADRLAEDGYVAVAQGGIASVAAAGAALDRGAELCARHAEPESDGKIGVLAFGPALIPALGLASEGRIDALIGFTSMATAVPPALARAIKIPLAIHLAGEEDLHDGLKSAFAGRRNVRLFHYPKNSGGFVYPGHANYDRFAAGIAYSRGLSVLRRVLGPDYDLSNLFAEHLRQEFVCHDADATMTTMVEQPYVNHVPTMTGGYGHDMLKRFYKYHFIPTIPKDRENTMISEIVGSDSVVLEGVNAFTFNERFDHYLPGLAPSGKRVHVPFVVIAKFRGDRLYYEHIYWDQATILAQLGLIDPTGLPIAGREQAAKVLDPSLPSNALMKMWSESEGKPL